MKNLMAIFALMGLIFLAQNAFAASATSELSWSAPTERVDGTPMDLDEIAEYRVFYSVDGEPTTDSEFITIERDATSETVTLELTPRAEDYTVSFAIVVVDTNGLVSQPSEMVSKVFNVESTSVPRPATNLQFTITCEDGCTIEEVFSR